jgi:hypothetical protein
LHDRRNAVHPNPRGSEAVRADPAVVSDFLKAQQGPNRPIPDETFVSEKTMKLGGKTIELTRHFYHSNEGDLFIYVPEAKFMMAVDCVTPGQPGCAMRRLFVQHQPNQPAE